VSPTLAGAEANGIALSVQHITKEFPGVVALNDVSLDVAAGEIHAVVGENGAGKSTLMHIIAGVYTPDKGVIYINGEPYAPADESAAQRAGVAIVYQEGSLFNPLTVAENIFAGRQPVNSIGVVDFNTMNKLSQELLETLETNIKSAMLVQDLSPGQRQLVEIAKALSQNVKILILDEPTSSLTINETNHLFNVMRRLKGQGVAIICVTHRLAEVFEVADKATVLKDGKLSGVRIINETTPEEIIRLQVGRELSFARDSRRVGPEAELTLEIKDLVAPKVNGVSLNVHAGEIVCLAGLIGAGRTELCEALFGKREILSGSIKINGKPFKPRHPIDAMNAGIGMVPEDRHDLGLFLPMTIADNVVAADLKMVSKKGIVNKRIVTETTEKYSAELRIATPDIFRQVMYLSGGNQQKVLIAKWLVRKPTLLIVDEPTRGVDVGAKSDLYEIVRTLAEQGVAVLVVSSDLPEVLALSHRIIVMAEGHTVGELDAATADEFSILQMAMPVGVLSRKGE